MMEQDQCVAGAIIMGVVVMMLVMLAIYAVVCYLVFSLLKAVPEQHQKMQPGLVWLLMIPCFNLVWNFVVFPKLSQSYESSLNASGDTSAGNCFVNIAWAYAIAVACSLIPCVNYVAGPASLVLLIIYLVKMFGLKAKLA